MIRRDDEIKQIRTEYSWFYPLLMGGFLVIVGIVIGASLFGSNTPVLEGNMLAYGTNLWTEAISIGITVFILDQINRRRDRLAAEAKDREVKTEAEKMEKQRLIIELRSRDNATALTALEEIREKGWHRDGTLANANLYEAQLQGAMLWESILEETNLIKSNLQSASMVVTNLRNANLQQANLQNAHLTNVDLRNAILDGSQLQDAQLFNVNLEATSLGALNLQGTMINRCNMRGANLSHTNLKFADIRDNEFDTTTILPDDKYWTPETDMRRYTDLSHPDFWQPDWAKEQKD
jgi:hypothetical protein